MVRGATRSGDQGMCSFEANVSGRKGERAQDAEEYASIMGRLQFQGVRRVIVGRVSQ